MSSKDKSKNKKRTTTTYKTKNKKKRDPWASFWSTTVYTIIFFWVLFHFIHTSYN